MTSQVSLTFGTKPILQRIQADNPQNELISLSATSGAAQLMLLDVSDHPSVFANPISFSVLNQRLSPDDMDLFVFINLQMDVDHAKILRASVDHFPEQAQPVGQKSLLFMVNKRAQNEYLLITTWTSIGAFHAWVDSNSFDVFRPFYKQQQFRYREVTYTKADLNK